jgi:hypothetical protein
MDHRRKKSTLFVGALLATCLAAPSHESYAEDKHDSPSSIVNQTLTKESQGVVVDRRDLLKDSADKAARWHAGQLQRDGQWVDVDDLQDLSDKEREYEQLRQDLQDDADGHRKLAKWCHRHNLDLQARAHWHAVIEKLPNDFEARRQLGHQWIDDAWYTESEIKAAGQATQERLKEIKEWNGQIVKILNGLRSRDSSEKQEWLRKLNKIDDPGAIASLEMAALQTDDDLAKLLIDSISKNRSKSACMSLTRIALADPTSARGQHAIAQLKQYDQTFMVPELLSLLSTPIETRMRYGFNQRGELMLDRIMFRETKDRREMVQLQRLVRTNEAGGNVVASVRRAGGTTSRARGTTRGDIQTFADEQAANSLAGDDQVRIEKEVAAANEQQEKQSRKVSLVLAELTDQPATNKADDWWKWWQAKNYRPAKPKPLALKQYQQVDQPTLRLTSYEASPRLSDCLVAGTLVQTASGLRPIETLKGGDLVVSQDVESGKLDLKPIIQVVPREPGPIVVIKTDDDEIRSTQGHRWWVPGKGWVMAAELESGMTLHTATGTVRVNEVREETEQATINLVVDEYHTYFVGKERLLSFDNIEPRPTLRRVPGYAESK